MCELEGPGIRLKGSYPARTWERKRRGHWPGLHVLLNWWKCTRPVRCRDPGRDISGGLRMHLRDGSLAAAATSDGWRSRGAPALERYRRGIRDARDRSPGATRLPERAVHSVVRLWAVTKAVKAPAFVKWKQWCTDQRRRRTD